MKLSSAPEPGAFILNKGPGPTSHDAVTKVKRLLKAKRAGHTGTLDPFATGVLIVLLNSATRLASMFLEDFKEYFAVMELGAATDTYDLTGTVTKRGDYSGVTQEMALECLQGFMGKIEQTPPMFSAAKVDGTPLYKLARAGKTVDRARKTVEITAAELVSFAPPLLTVKFTCSAGTFIRSIAHELGEKLGCGAHLKELERTRCGTFGIDLASTAESLEMDHTGAISRSFVKISDLLGKYPKIQLDSDIDESIKNGIHPALADLSLPEDIIAEPGGRFRLISPENALRAVAEIKAAPDEELYMRLLKVFKDNAA